MHSHTHAYKHTYMGMNASGIYCNCKQNNDTESIYYESNKKKENNNNTNNN